MIFKLKADAEFEADSIDDAFIVLAAHFIALEQSGIDAPEIINQGFIDIAPKQEE